MDGSTRVTRSNPALWLGLVAVVALVACGAWLMASYFYARSENRNFEELRRRSELDCTRLPLHCAVRDEDHATVNDYLVSGGDPELLDGWGRTALSWAVQNDRLELVATLLSGGANPNARDHAEVTVFHQAVLQGSYETADSLLTAGADIDAMNGNADQETTLHHCVMQNQRECVEFLLARGADQGLEDSYGYTPLQRVELHDHIDESIGELLRGREEGPPEAA